MRGRYGSPAGRMAAAVLIGLCAGAPPALAADPVFRDFPLVVYCDYNGITSAYYFSQLEQGRAIYLTPDRQAGSITIDGTALRVGGERSGTCRDKTLPELREAGQAFDLPR